MNDISSVQIFFLNIPLIFLENFSLSLKSFGFISPFSRMKKFVPLLFNKFLIVSLQTLLPIPETNRSLLIANGSDSSLCVLCVFFPLCNLCISRKIILSSFRDTFFGLTLLNLLFSTTFVESIVLAAC